jgi:trigger factor
MKVTVDDVSGVKKTLHIEIPQDEVARKVGAAYDQLKKTAKIKGFRPGRVPRNVLERRFRKQVHSDVTSDLIQSSFLEAVRETDLNVLGTPQIEPPELDPGSDYRYDALVEVQPEIGDIEFTGIPLKKKIYSISQGEIEAQLKMIQKNMAERKLVEEDRPIRDGDFVMLDYEGFLDGKPHEEIGSNESFILKVGSGIISPDFDAHLVGRKAGEDAEFPVRFPEDHGNESLAGKELTFRVHVKEIREEALPEIDDALAAKVGPYEDLSALEKVIRDNLESGYQKRVEQELNEQIFQALLDKTSFEVPDALLDMELEGILAETEQAFQAQSMKLEDAGLTREGLQEKYRGTAEKQVRRHLILDKIIRQEKLEVSDEQLQTGIQEMADGMHQPIEVIQEYYRENPERLNMLKQTLLEKAAIRLIMDQNDIEEVPPESDPASGEG